MQALLRLIATFCSANFSKNPGPESRAHGIDGLNFLSCRNDAALLRLLDLNGVHLRSSVLDSFESGSHSDVEDVSLTDEW